MFPNQSPQPPQAPNPFQPQEQAPSPPPATVPSAPQAVYPSLDGAPAPADYLNQIAPQSAEKSPFSFGIKQVLVISAALIALVIIMALAVGAFSTSKKEPLERLSVRLTATEKIAVEAQGNLKSSKLRSVNSNLKLYLTNTNRDIGAPLLAAGVTVAKLDKKVIVAESTTALEGRLVDAKLNGVFDRTYAREMTFQLGTILTLLSETYNATSNPTLKAFLKSAYDNLKPTQESFANFSTSS